MRQTFIIIFFLICIAPVTQMLMGLPDAQPVAQDLATVPDVDVLQSPLLWSKQEQAWFQDHFGYRSFFIRLKEQIDVSLFHTSSHIHIGKDGQLYYRSVVDKEEPAIQEQLRLHQDQILRNIGRFADALAERGVTTIITINLMNNHLVPDKLPLSAPQSKVSPRLDMFVEQLKPMPHVDFFDSTPILRDLAKTQPVFQKTDFHWTNVAAATVARALVDHISVLENRKPPVWSTPVRGTTTPGYTGGMAEAMPLLFTTMTEDKINVVPDILAPEGATEARGTIYDYEYHSNSNNPLLLPPLFIQGDSFSYGLVSEGMAHCFKSFYRMIWTPTGEPMNKISAAMAVYPPDAKYFMMQAIEVQAGFFNSFADDDEVTRAIALFRQRPLNFVTK